MKNHDHKGERSKDKQHRHNESVHGLSPDLRNFHKELEDKFGSVRMTSGRREKSPSGKFSHHHNGDALDIGKEHSDVFDYLYNTKEGLQLMDKYQLGILDETDPEMLKKTKGTGAHFHIGKDSGLYSKTRKRLKLISTPSQNGDGNSVLVKKHSFISQNPAYDYSTGSMKGSKNSTDGGFIPIPQNNDLSQNSQPSTVIQGSVGGIDITIPNNTLSQMMIADIEKSKTRNEINNRKIEQSSARRELLAKEQDRKEYQRRVQSYFEGLRNDDNRDLTRKIQKENSERTSQARIDEAMHQQQQQLLRSGSRTEMRDLPQIFES